MPLNWKKYYLKQVKTHRCDACRAVAHRFDAAFDLAEAAVLDDDRRELDDGKISIIFAC